MSWGILVMVFGGRLAQTGGVIAENDKTTPKFSACCSLMKDGYIEEMDWEVLMDFSRICLLNSRKLPHFILYISRFLVYSIRYTYSTQIACAPTRADKKSIQYDNYTD